VRLAGHLLAAVLGWVGLAAVWIWQLSLGVPARWVEGPLAMLVVFALWVGFLFGWIVWSKSIYRRRHRRTTAVSYELGLELDSLGRRVAVVAGTARARRVEISVPGPGVKAYGPAVQEREGGEEVA
jgi:hypothetical protein